MFLSDTLVRVECVRWIPKMERILHLDESQIIVYILSVKNKKEHIFFMIKKVHVHT